MTLKVILMIWIAIPLNVVVNNWWFHALTILSLSLLLIFLEIRRKANPSKSDSAKKTGTSLEGLNPNQLLEQQTKLLKKEIAALKEMERSNLILRDSYRLFLQFLMAHSKELAREETNNVISLDAEFVKDLLGHMEENLSDPLFNVKNLCRKLDLSQPSLYRKVRNLTGHSPQLFIRSYRLERAVQLLRKNYGNVTQVCFEVGFTSTAYFTKCFKEKFKQLPSNIETNIVGHR